MDATEVINYVLWVIAIVVVMFVASRLESRS